MRPLDLTPEQHAALYAAARRRAHQLRDEAIADAIRATIEWLRARLAPRRTITEGLPCHS